MLKFGHIELLVADTKVSEQFYRDILGFETVVEQPGGFIWMQLNGFELLLRPSQNNQTIQDFSKTKSNIVFYVSHLRETQNKLRERGLEFSGHDQGCPTFHDPDGHWFQLVDPNSH